MSGSPDYAILDSDDDDMGFVHDSSKESKSQADPNAIDAMETGATQENLDTTAALNEFKKKVSTNPLICSIPLNQTGSSELGSTSSLELNPAGTMALGRTARTSSIKSQQLVPDYFHKKH